MAGTDGSLGALAAVGQSLSNFVCLFSREGRQLLHERAISATAFQKLEVRKLEIQIAAERLEVVSKLVEELRKIDDAKLRNRLEKVVLTILSKDLGWSEMVDDRIEGIRLAQTDQPPLTIDSMRT